jgi:alkylhydroperoxidase/carboxymuconolactone decarboxylase family protein YurZ
MSAPTSASGFSYGMDDVVKKADPAFADAYERMVTALSRSSVLPAKVQELIGLAVNAAPTHLNRDAVIAHVRGARNQGASDAEIIEALQIATCLGIHALTFGGAILREESAALEAAMANELSPRQRGLQQHWVEGSGRDWLPVFDVPLQGDPDFFEAWCDLMNIPVARHAIEPKVRELIYLALDGGITHMHPGTRAHIRLAMRFGASDEEILAALSLASLVAVQGYGWGVHALVDDDGSS